MDRNDSQSQYADAADAAIAKGVGSAAPAPTVSEALVESIAVVTHEANRAYCVEIGDYSQKPWSEAPDWQRESAIAGVRGIISGETKTPEQSHESWLAHKAADGWTYGAVKDAAAKTHPCFVPYDQLPREQRAKDHLFRAVVTSLVEALV